MKRLNPFLKKKYNSIGYQEVLKTETYKRSKYNIEQTVSDGVLIYNLFTCELIILTVDEYNQIYCSSFFVDNMRYRFLIQHWFLIPESFDEYSMVYSQKLAFKNRHSAKSLDKVTRYVIFTTTNCNANCYYCYESSYAKRDMTYDTAKDVVDFITKTVNGKAFIQWFGGEPLCNSTVISQITEGLTSVNVNFESSMISNGYLLDKTPVSTIRDSWRMKRIQITLDGTADFYNQIRSYTDADENPFETVLSNIEIMLKNDIRINVRLNVSSDNKDDLMSLISILKDRFGSYTNFSVYSHVLYLSEEEMSAIFDSYKEIQNELEIAGLLPKESLSYAKATHCMADNHRGVCITPEGNLSLCEHYVDSEIIGSIYDFESLDKGKLEEWSEPMMDCNCKDCLLFPRCVRICKCPADPCMSENNEYQIETIKKMMIRKWSEQS